MDAKKIAIIVLVVVVVAAAAVIVYDGDGERKGDYTEIDVKTSLAVFGNANGDALINDYDVDILEDIRDGKRPMKDYPLADANQDGVIDDEDISIVKKMMNHERCIINVVCYDLDDNQTVVETGYPLDNVVVSGTNLNATVLYINGAEHVAGYFGSNYPNFETPLRENAVGFGGSSGSVSEGWAAFTALDGELRNEGGIGAFLTDTTTSSAITKQYKDDLDQAGIPLIILNFVSAEDEVSASLLLGFLLGEETERIAQDYAVMCWKVLDRIEAKTSGLKDGEKASVISITMGFKVAKNSSDNYTTLSEAGAIPYYEINAEFKEKFDVSKSTAITTGETLANFDDADFIVSIRSVDSKSGDLRGTMVSTWDKYYSYFNDLDNYEDLVYVNHLLPGAVKLAYLLEYMYPGTVEAGYGDSVFAEVAEVCSYLDGCTVENTFTAMGYSDYKAAGGTH